MRDDVKRMMSTELLAFAEKRKVTDYKSGRERNSQHSRCRNGASREKSGMKKRAAKAALAAPKNA